MAEGDGCQFQQTVQFIRRGKSGHKNDAEGVDDGLQNHAAHGDDRTLEGQRTGQGQQTGQYRFIRFPMNPL